VPGGSSQPFSPCQAYLTYTTSVALGAQSGIEECKFQFAWERWNCPENALQLSTHNRLRGGKSTWEHTCAGSIHHGSELAANVFMECMCVFTCVYSEMEKWPII
jgi:hypothetical protein